MRKGLTTSEAGRLGALAAAKTIAVQKQQRIEEWNANPKLCKFCSTPLDYHKDRRNDFCSQSCGAKYSNLSRGRVLAEDKTYDCLFCSKAFQAYGNNGTPPKYCSRECMMAFWWKNAKAELLLLGVDNSSANRAGKKYLIELHNGKCQICGLSEWQEQPMPLVLDHFDGDPYNNSLSNLRITCNNCDALSPTYKGRNKGNGRFKRAERYKKEKELFGDMEDFKFKH